VKSNTFESELNHDSRSPLINDPWRRLAAAVVARAAQEAKKGDLGACAWLEGEGADYADILGYNPEMVVAMAEKWSQSPGGAIVIKLVEARQWQR